MPRFVNINIEGEIMPSKCLEYEKIILDCKDDSTCQGVNIYFDTYGGAVDGIKSVVNAIEEINKTKETTAIIVNAHSAGYWIACACKKVLLKDETSYCGCIGAIQTHISYEKYNKQQGIEVTEVFSTPYKNIFSRNKPLSKEAKEIIEKEIKYCTDLFISDVKRFRNLTDLEVEKVCSGLSFNAKEAIEYKLVDGFYKKEAENMENEEIVKKLEQLITEMQEIKGKIEEFDKRLQELEKTDENSTDAESEEEDKEKEKEEKEGKKAENEDEEDKKDKKKEDLEATKVAKAVVKELKSLFNQKNNYKAEQKAYFPNFSSQVGEYRSFSLSEKPNMKDYEQAVKCILG